MGEGDSGSEQSGRRSAAVTGLDQVVNNINQTIHSVIEKKETFCPLR
ncbi:hypothetical protein OLMES_2367 [Oleiphilus messinensis]|uniref:Uncharacterized protein n=1 Tax=Oleiphilus messinensis TaxID=141451 RepID=A0A1Y0I871_9GAMM|nr:hypothetical protein OLMES_2367 [Oleiphilus messinensis]